MTIEQRVGGKPGCHVVCDGCGKVYEPCEPSVQEAWGEAYALGWRSIRNGQYCAQCVAQPEPLALLLGRFGLGL